VADPALCHGAVVLGHVHNRRYQLSGARLRDAARSSRERSVELARPPESGGR
jgi:hypothetical protein